MHDNPKAPDNRTNYGMRLAAPNTAWESLEAIKKQGVDLGVILFNDFVADSHHLIIDIIYPSEAARKTMIEALMDPHYATDLDLVKTYEWQGPDRRGNTRDRRRRMGGPCEACQRLNRKDRRRVATLDWIDNSPKTAHTH